MRFYQFAYFGSLFVVVGAQLAVMYVCFPLWRRQRLHFALLFAWAALVGLFRVLVDHFSLNYGMTTETWEFTWTAIQLLTIVGQILYSTAVVLLARHLLALSEIPAAPPPNCGSQT